MKNGTFSITRFFGVLILCLGLVIFTISLIFICTFVFSTGYLGAVMNVFMIAAIFGIPCGLLIMLSGALMIWANHEENSDHTSPESPDESDEEA